MGCDTSFLNILYSFEAGIAHAIDRFKWLTFENLTI